MNSVSRARDVADAVSEKTLTVTEIFKSIQGESTWAGTPCVFIRLTGCNVGCTYCDTTYAYENGQTLCLEEVFARCEALGGRLAEITGGEPLLQPNCPALAAGLIERGFTVLCETSGTRPISVLPEAAIKIMDLKCPGSGVCEKNDWSNIDALSPRDEVKFVIGNRADYEWSRETVRRYTLARRCNAVLFAPVFGGLEARLLAEWILEDGLEVRLQLQLHKYIWPPDRRGV